MRPILYPRGQTIFSGNGIGILSDTISCKCSEVLNGPYEIELTVPTDGNHAVDISTNCVIKVKPNYDDSPQPFRIYSVEQDINGLIVVKAAHLSYDTSGIPILPFTAESLDEAVENLNTNRKLVRPSNFVLNANFSAEGTLQVSTPSSFRALLGGNENTIANVYGGEYHYDDYVVELLQRRGVDKGICFRYGKNITDFEQEENSEELYSAVLGFWKKSGSGDTPDTFVYGDIIEVENVLPYDKIYVLDTSDKIKNEDDSDPTEDQVNDYVRQYIATSAIGLPNYSMKISYAEDDNIIRVCLGDTVGVLFPDYGINTKARCSKVVFDCLLERNESIEIGVVSTGISDSVALVSNKTSSTSTGAASNFSGQSSEIQRIIDSAAHIYYQTTAGWNEQPSLIAERGAIYVYSDHSSAIIDGQAKSVPGIKVGDGTSYLLDMPFLDSGSDGSGGGSTDQEVLDLLTEHINNTSIHVSSNDRSFWNGKTRAYVGSDQQSETLILTNNS